MKTIDTEELVGAIRHIIENEGREVSLVISGSSMAPFLIHHRDSVLLGPIDRQLIRGDIVLYQRDNGQYVLHRIQRVHADGCYDTIGDAQTESEIGIRRNQIFAIVKNVKRKGKWIGLSSFWWHFFERTWMDIIPLRRLIMRIYP
ncbi:MAG: S24/S26 family peptidase [Bacteroidales bacterium]|nr:S24/S26 family peptidase [Bacteroidales bacterium]MCH3939921.1 S24/S26 family peptidase [Bacteroidales bacterium]MCI2135247.1 S24/S26 family peptidase [Bacteroidales bacterium]MDY6320085.1 S24/S26 family peptidase [Bacteroidales bacterium]